MTETDGKQIVGYVRVSTDEQARDGVSLAAQGERIAAFAKSQGWVLAEIFQDNFTGTAIDRPGLTQLKERIEAGAVGVVLVYKVDRLARSQRLTLQIIEDLFDSNGVVFKSVTEPFETDCAMGKAFLGMLAVFSQLERDTIVERTKHALDHKKQQGEHCGRIPFGYKMGESGRLERDPGEQALIGKIKRLSRQGLTLRTISDRLDIPRSTVHRLLKVHQKTRNAKYDQNLVLSPVPQTTGSGTR